MKYVKDVVNDIGLICWEFVIVAIKVVVIYLIINNTTNMEHNAALETAILVGAVDFLSGQRTHLKTVTDIKETITYKIAGKSITSRKSYHSEDK